MPTLRILSLQILSLAVTALLVALSAPVPAAEPAALQVTVTGVQPGRGDIRVAVCLEKTFLGDCRPGQVQAASTDTVTFTFDGLPAGRYALQAFHDLDGDGELDTSLFGAPREPVGFSRDAIGSMGPPDFEAAAFDLPAAGMAEQRFSLRYR